jgi:ribosomal protein L11 methyltransferase
LESEHIGNDYIELKLSFPPQLEAQVLGLIYSSQINSLLEHEPTENSHSVSIYFGTKTELNIFLNKLTESQIAELSYQVSSQPIVDWQNNWKQYWTPQRITDSLVIVPAWQEYQRVNDELVVKIDTTSAFGTGSHETTKLCLEFTNSIRISTGVKSYLDFGCGSGILAITASKLGITKVWGYDIDPAAISCATKNAELNYCNEINFTASLSNIADTFEVVVANIISSVLITEWPNITKLISPGGLLFVSGLLETEIDSFLNKTQLTPIEIKRDGEWVGMSFRI